MFYEVHTKASYKKFFIVFEFLQISFRSSKWKNAKFYLLFIQRIKIVRRR